MERLQEALNRARARREQVQSGDVPAAASDAAAQASAVGASRGTTASAGPAPRPRTGDAQAAWAALSQFTPDERLLANNRVVSFFGDREASPYDMMRTKVLQQAQSQKWRRIAVTSATPKCGKTTTAANLAFSLARQTDLRTMLVEIDLRRPALARLLGQSDDFAFSRFLDGRERPEDHMLAYGGNLAFCLNNKPVANPSELLHSARAQDALAELEQIYQPDIVLFDTAPLMASDDTFGFLQRVDAGILVAAAEMTTIDEIDVAESEMAEHTHVLGVVFNKARYFSGGKYGYEYGYY